MRRLQPLIAISIIASCLLPIEPAHSQASTAGVKGAKFAPADGPKLVTAITNAGFAPAPAAGGMPASLGGPAAATSDNLRNLVDNLAAAGVPSAQANINGVQIVFVSNPKGKAIATATNAIVIIDGGSPDCKMTGTNSSLYCASPQNPAGETPSANADSKGAGSASWAVSGASGTKSGAATATADGFATAETGGAVGGGPVTVGTATATSNNDRAFAVGGSTKDGGGEPGDAVAKGQNGATARGGSRQGQNDAQSGADATATTVNGSAEAVAGKGGPVAGVPPAFIDGKPTSQAGSGGKAKAKSKNGIATAVSEGGKADGAGWTSGDGGTAEASGKNFSSASSRPGLAVNGAAQGNKGKEKLTVKK